MNESDFDEDEVSSEENELKVASIPDKLNDLDPQELCD